jgi:hypothetical protein
MKKLSWLWLALTILAPTTGLADKAPPNMEKYYVVLLKRVPNAPKLEGRWTPSFGPLRGAGKRQLCLNEKYLQVIECPRPPWPGRVARTWTSTAWRTWSVEVRVRGGRMKNC